MKILLYSNMEFMKYLMQDNAKENKEINLECYVVP